MIKTGFPRHWSSLKKLMWLRGSPAGGAKWRWATVTGNPVTLSNAVAAKLRQLKIAFSPVQEGSGDPSPDNVRPISGWSSLTVEQRGKNLLDISMLLEASGWIVDANGDYYGTSSTLYAKFKKETGGFIDFGESGFSARLRFQAYYKQSSDGGGFGLKFVYTDGTESGVIASGTTDFAWKWWNSTPDKTIRRVYFTYGSSKGLTVRKFGLYLYNADYTTAEDYDAPYNPSSRSISISLGQTVYSGYVDVVTGVGEITWAAVDMGELGWTYYTVNEPHAFYADVTEREGGYDFLCSIYPNAHATRVNLPDKSIGIWTNASNKRITIRDSAYTDATTFQTAMTGQTICYKLATPIPFHVDPQQINSLAGANNMWTDADTLTVEYRKDGNVSDAEALSMLLGGRYTPATGPDDVSDAEALSIITGGNR